MTTATGGNDYLECRRELLKRYCHGWLKALHDQDTELFARAVYDASVEIAEDKMEDSLLGTVTETDQSSEDLVRVKGSRVLNNSWTSTLADCTSLYQ